MTGARGFDDPRAADFRERAKEWIPSAIPKEWAERETNPLSEIREREVRRDWGKSLWTGGFAGITWPSEYGGAGLGVVEEFIFFEESAYARAPESLDTIGKYLAGPAIMAVGTDEQKRRHLRPILQGEEVWAEGFSEPNAGSDLANASTLAVRHGNEYIINGQKIWTSFAEVSQRCYLLAKTSIDAPRHHNLSIILLDMIQDGIDIRPIHQITGKSDFSEVFFTDVRAPVTDLLGKENDGWYLSTVNGFRKERAIREGLRRYVEVSALTRDLQRCAEECLLVRPPSRSTIDDLIDDVELLKMHVMRLTELKAQSREDHGAGAIVKMYWADVVQHITEVGVSLGCAIHADSWFQAYLESRWATIAGGTNEIQRNVIATQIIGLPR